MTPNSRKTYYNQSVEEITEKLKTSLEQGLSNEEAKQRLTTFGANEFEKKKSKSIFYKFFSQFKSFMIIVLIIAAVISGVVGFLHGEGFTDAIIILVIVVLNALIGTIQEAKAEQSLQALEKLSAPHCKVIRDGNVQVIESREIVPGDIIVLDTGDSIPADLRLFESVNLKVQEAALTGESIPVEKNTETIKDIDVALGDRHNMAFSSCLVTYGRGKGVVVSTGTHTEVGKIAEMLQAVPDTKTPLQEKLDKLGKFLGIAALAICILIFAVGLLYRKDLLEMFMIAVSLAAAAIPEGLPAVSTIVLAVGVQRLVKKNAIVRTLPSVETLGSTSVICSDKTGTLTQNKMTVVKLYADNSTVDIDTVTGETLTEDQRYLIQISVLANDASLSENGNTYTTTGDPTETALIDLGFKFSYNKNVLDSSNRRIEEIPFDSERKMMTTVHQEVDGLVVLTKGAFDEILLRSKYILIKGETVPLDESYKKAIKETNLHMAENALRVLAFAYKKIDILPETIDSKTIENDLIFVGMLGMIDPPRPEAKISVEKCREAGIKPVMITGDHKITANAIASQLGILRPGEKTMSGNELEKLTDEELVENVHDISVYARVSPEHKVRIVNAFQHTGNIVAMTGDGVNDAPALKLADIGCAMGITGTDVAKEAANVILTDDNFSTIVAAVEEGRRIYDNILKAIQFMLSTNIGEIIVLFVAILFNWGTPLLPIHILWINLVTDSLPALALSVDPAQQGIMRRKPIDSTKGIMTKGFSLQILLQGAMIGIFSLIAFRIGMQTSLEVAQTMTFAVLAFTQLTHVFNVRSYSHSAFRDMFKNKLLLGAIAIVAALMIIVLEVPALHDIFHITDPNMHQWLWVIGLSLAPLPTMELVKVVRRFLIKKGKL